ncbi:hypothetical protein K438DRAFT_413950 [Mycena galopus ATCC 62051]|nr:hypothetical protein K438DRAFT_413950 [Mycena galopus ATCC 62051]
MQLQLILLACRTAPQRYHRPTYSTTMHRYPTCRESCHDNCPGKTTYLFPASADTICFPGCAVQDAASNNCILANRYGAAHSHCIRSRSHVYSYCFGIAGSIAAWLRRATDGRTIGAVIRCSAVYHVV